MIHRFENSCHMNILTWKLYQKISSLKDLELAKGRIFKWDYVIFSAKIWTRKSFISSSKSFIYLLWPFRVLVLTLIKLGFSRIIFSGGVKLTSPPSYFKKNLSNISITLYYIVKGMLRPIFCIDINTHSDRKWKIL